MIPSSCGCAPVTAMACGCWLPVLLRRSCSSCPLSLRSRTGLRPAPPSIHLPEQLSRPAGLLHLPTGLFNSSVPCNPQGSTLFSSQASQTLTEEKLLLSVWREERT